MFGMIAGAIPSVAQVPMSVTNPIEVRLQPEAIGNETSGGSQFYKYGIYASIGGSGTPQLYEFDTGAAGFYAVYSTNTAVDSPAWGGDSNSYPIVSTNDSIEYVSSNDYSGNIVATAVALYSADGNDGFQANAVISTAPPGSTNVLVGQVTSISDSASGDILWPNTNEPPVDKNFYGDFGAALTYTNSGIMNILAQLNYSSGVIPGFVIKLGTNGNADPVLQLGMTSNELSQYPYQFAINGMNATNPFPVAQGSTNTIPTYDEGVINATYTLGNSNNVSWTNTGPVVLDTGASGFLRNDTNSEALDPLITGTMISNGVHFNLSLTNSDGTAGLSYSSVTGTNPGDISLLALQGGYYALNVGQDLFHQYNVAYDLQDGIIAFQPLQPVPEAHAGLLVLLGMMTISATALLSKFINPKTRNCT